MTDDFDSKTIEEAKRLISEQFKEELKPLFKLIDDISQREELLSRYCLKLASFVENILTRVEKLENKNTPPKPNLKSTFDDMHSDLGVDPGVKSEWAEPDKKK